MSLGYNTLPASYCFAFINKLAEIIESEILPLPSDFIDGASEFDSSVVTYLPTNYFKKKRIAVFLTDWDSEKTSDMMGRTITVRALVRIYYEKFPNKDDETSNLLKITNLMVNYFHETETMTDANGLIWLNIDVPSVRLDKIFIPTGHVGSEFDITATAEIRYAT